VSEVDIVCVVVVIVEVFGIVGVVFNNVGIICCVDVFEMLVEEWDWVFVVNVCLIFFMCKYVVLIMVVVGGGLIVNIGFGWGLKGGGWVLFYCVFKGVVVNMMWVLVIDYGL